MRIRRLGPALPASLLLALLLPAVLTPSAALAQAQKVSFRLDWIPTAHHALFYAAVDRGFYTEAGLNVEILPGTGSGDAVKLVGNASNDFGFADAGAMAQGRSKGIPVKMVGVVYSRSPIGIAALADLKITKAKDLEGHSVGIAPGSAEAWAWLAFVNVNGIDGDKVRRVNVGPALGPQSLLERKIEALAGFVTGNLLIAETRGAKVTVLRFGDHGVEIYGNGIITHDALLRRDRALVGRFVQATFRGVQWVMQRPDEGIDILRKYHPTVDERFARAAIRRVIDLIESPATRERGLGWMTAQQWERTQEILARFAGLSPKSPLEDLFTNEFLGRAPGR